jgi:hypothetical protein
VDPFVGFSAPLPPPPPLPSPPPPPPTHPTEVLGNQSDLLPVSDSSISIAIF